MIDIKGLNKGDVLSALYNASRPQGMGFLHYSDTPMQREEAEQLLEQDDYFDYLKGRVMKVKIRGEELDERLFDRDNGHGAAEQAIAALRKGDAEAHAEAHRKGKLEAAAAVMEDIATPTTMQNGVVSMGLGDVSYVLSPAVMCALDEETKRGG